MSTIRLYQNNFKSGELGKETHGRFDLKMYNASCKYFKNGVANAQGSLTNKTLVTKELLSPNVAIGESKFFEFNREISDLPEGSLAIIYQELISRNIRIGTKYIDGQEHFSSYKTRSKVSSFTTQVSDVMFYTSDEHSEDYVSVLKGSFKSPATDYRERIKIFFDQDSKDGITITGVNSDTADISYFIDGNELVLDVTNSQGTTTDNLNVDKFINFEATEEVPQSHFFSEEIDNSLYEGEIDLSEIREIFSSTYIETENSEDEIFEENDEFIRTSKPFEYNYLDPETFEKVTETRYRIYRSNKIKEAHYYGAVSSKYYVTDYNVSVNNANVSLPQEYTCVINFKESETPIIHKYIYSIETLNDFIKEKPSGSENIFGNYLNETFNRTDINYAMWRYDITDDTFNIKFYDTLDSKQNNLDKAPEGAITFNDYEKELMEEIYIQGGIGRLNEDEDDTYLIKSYPSADTAWVDNVKILEKVVWKKINLKSIWFKKLLDLTRVKVTAFYSGRLILANTKEGANTIAFSTLNDIKSFAKRGLGVLDPYVTKVTTTPNMSIENIFGYKSLMLFTDKGIFASGINQEVFNPSTAEFPIVTKIIPSPNVEIAFLNEGMAFVNSNNNRVYLAFVSDVTQEYNILDLNIVNESIVEGITDMVNVEFNNDTGYSYLLIHSELNDVLLQYVKSEELLSWTRLDFGFKGFYGSGIVERKTFTVNATKGIIYEIEEGFTDTTVLETLPPNAKSSDGVPAVFRNSFQHLSVKLQVYGNYDISVNGVRKTWEYDIEDKSDTHIVEFPQIVASVNENITIKILTKEEVIIQGIMTTTNI